MADIKDETLLSISKTEPRDGNWTEVRVVRWIIDGEPKSVRFERRKFYNDKDTGEAKMGKAEGFTIADLKLVAAKWKEIISIIQTPPPYKPAKQEPVPDLEDVPF